MFRILIQRTRLVSKPFKSFQHQSSLHKNSLSSTSKTYARATRSVTVTTPTSALTPEERQQQKLKDAVAEDILSTYFEKKRSSSIGESETSSSSSSSSSTIVTVERADFASVDLNPPTLSLTSKALETAASKSAAASEEAEMEQQQHQHLQQQKEQQQQQEALERLEKLRLKKEARGKAKEMIGELSEMAEYFRSTEAEQQRQLKDSTEGGKQDQGITKEEKEEDEDWFVGKSFGVAKGSVTEMETPEVDEKEYVIQDRKEEDALYDEKESAQEVGFTPKWMRAAAASQARREGREEENAESSESDGILKPHHITRALEMERGGNIAVLDVSAKCEWTETMVIVEGKSKKQLFSMIDGVRRVAKKFVGTDPAIASNMAIEGSQTDDWMVLDLGRIVVHVMTPEARVFYDLDGLWGSTGGGLSDGQAEMDDEAAMIASVEAAWNDRPTTLVKTKQIEAEDLFDVEDVQERLASGKRVFGRVSK